MKYEVVIGIETHVQLATKSKLFCGCNNDSREAKPNAHVCPVCIALPGALPVLNKAAVELALKAGLALNAYSDMLEFHTKFDRKNYFYPDSPSGYQITQFDEPIIGNGFVEFPFEGETKRVGITRAHLEADAGKLTHPAGKDYSLVDLNRAGTPLLEIVSEPDMRSAAEAKAYAEELYHLMRYAGVSDCDLYYGNMRFDVNVSLRLAGQKEFGTRTESKNLNSFRAVAGVVEYEMKRQAEILDAGEKVVQETRGWDESKGETFSQRTKEEAHDYRYFPEPDLPPVQVTSDMLKVASNGMPEKMPMELRQELAGAGISGREVETLVANIEAAELWLQLNIENPEQAKFAFNWLVGDMLRLAEAKGKSLRESDVSSLTVAAVGEMVAAGKLSSTNSKALLAMLWENDEGAHHVAEREGLLQQSDAGELEAWTDQVIKDNPKPVADYQKGEAKALGFLVGQVMKLSKGQANPPMVNEILKDKLKK
ncbi:MAG TPA: Asp-tRNA(Asn)/Glu-tRNA(Gln) amidotransferase subunit GatB [Candidatus Saccharimonadales bacterium]|nr:Asp-tRNA(Asn)/Glu-tRNA(Gln) amidotransferase subunit GatB [Candidatus Saccharimonadales bacterium]